MINPQEGREQYQVCGQNCDPPDENYVTPLFLKVNRSQQPEQPAKRMGIDLRGESDASLGCRCLNTANPSDVEQDRKMEADDFPQSQPLVLRASMARQ
jgi:hypothetical protein